MPKEKQQNNSEQAEFEQGILEDMEMAIGLAKVVLFTEPTLEDEHRLADYIDVADDDELLEKQLMKARAVSEKLFGSKADNWSVFELYEYLEGCDGEAGERLFADDMKRMVDHAKKLYGETPSPKQVFGLFDRMLKIEEK
jgi:hypothetical protein